MAALTAKAFAVVDAASGRVLAAHRADQRRHMASLTKMMTCYVVLVLGERLARAGAPSPLDQQVRISSSASVMAGTTARLRAGEWIAARDLLFGLMLPSGNDAAVALAEAFGALYLQRRRENRAGRAVSAAGRDRALTTDVCLRAFVSLMNDTARAIGLTATSYVNPHGLSVKGHMSTALDIARLASEALRLPLFRTLVQTAEHVGEVFDGEGAPLRRIAWRNTNEALGTIPGCFGIKTGVTPKAGPCLCAGIREQGGHRRRLIVVVMDCASKAARYRDIEQLLGSVAQGQAQEALFLPPPRRRPQKLRPLRRGGRRREVGGC